MITEIIAIILIFISLSIARSLNEISRNLFSISLNQPKSVEELKRLNDTVTKSYLFVKRHYDPNTNYKR
jgi:hypothetical protein